MTRPLIRATQAGIVALVAGGLILAWRSGVLAEVSEPSRLAQTLVAMGALGYVAFVAAYTLLQPFGVPGTVFVVAAPLIWSAPCASTRRAARRLPESAAGHFSANACMNESVAISVVLGAMRLKSAIALASMPMKA